MFRGVMRRPGRRQWTQGVVGGWIRDDGDPAAAMGSVDLLAPVGRYVPLNFGRLEDGSRGDRDCHGELRETVEQLRGSPTGSPGLRGGMRSTCERL